MREMKNSNIIWLGSIPSDWNILRVKNTSWLKGRIGWDGLKSEEFTDEGPYLITGTDFSDGKVNWDTCAHITEDRFSEDELLHIKEGDLLITKDGTIGKLAIVEGCPEKVSLNSGVMIIRNNSSWRYDQKFMYYILGSEVFTQWFESEQKPGSTIRHLYQHQFGEFRFPFPSLSEQRSIVSYLDKKCAAIDEAIARRQQMNEKLEEYRRSIVNQMLSTSEWPLVPLKYVVTYNDEKLSECTDPDFSFDYIDIGSVVYKYGLQYTQRMAFKDAPSRARRIVRNDDVILSTVRTYLKASVRITGIEYPTVASTGFITMRARKQKIVPDYLGYLVQWDGLVSEVEKRSYGTSYPAITAGEIVNIAVPVPSISKQRDAVKHLDEKCSLVDDIYARNIELINRLEEYRKSIIYNAVTGKIDCREVV